MRTNTDLTMYKRAVMVAWVLTMLAAVIPATHQIKTETRQYPGWSTLTGQPEPTIKHLGVTSDMKNVLITVELPDHKYFALKQAAVQKGLSAQEHISMIANIAIDRSANVVLSDTPYPDEDAQIPENCILQKQHTTSGGCLSKNAGVFYGPSGKETWYDLPMEHIVDRMRGLGFDAETYPYWIREDGCKMLGDFIMVAANLNTHPRGTTVDTSLGVGLVCDTGGFAAYDSTTIDIATNWYSQ